MSLVVDTLSAEKQQTGTAWCTIRPLLFSGQAKPQANGHHTGTRMGSIGQVIGYAAGALDLVGILGTGLGGTQFKQLTIIAGLIMILTNFVTCWAVSERILTARPPSTGGRFKLFSRIWLTVINLPPRISVICWAQFWSWIGWFPFLFYNTTWLGETYFRYDATPEDRASGDVLGKMGRIGSTSLVIYSTITFTSAFLLPLLVRSPDSGKAAAVVPVPLPAAAARVLRGFHQYRPDLLTTWMAGQLGFSVAMFMAPFAKSYRFATVLLCICGV